MGVLISRNIRVPQTGTGFVCRSYPFFFGVTGSWNGNRFFYQNISLILNQVKHIHVRTFSTGRLMSEISRQGSRTQTVTPALILEPGVAWRQWINVTSWTGGESPSHNNIVQRQGNRNSWNQVHPFIISLCLSN